MPLSLLLARKMCSSLHLTDSDFHLAVSASAEGVHEGVAHTEG